MLMSNHEIARALGVSADHIDNEMVLTHAAARAFAPSAMRNDAVNPLNWTDVILTRLSEIEDDDHRKLLAESIRQGLLRKKAERAADEVDRAREQREERARAEAQHRASQAAKGGSALGTSASARADSGVEAKLQAFDDKRRNAHREG